MSDEFEDISVVETEPVESGVPVDASAEAVPPEVTPPEVTPAEVAATKVNLDAGDEALKQNSQTAYLEANAPDRVNESGAAVTLAGIAAKVIHRPGSGRLTAPMKLRMAMKQSAGAMPGARPRR